MIASSLSSDLRDTPVKKLFWKYTLPTIIAIMVNGLYTIIDGFFIGHYIGEAGLAGLNVLWALISLLVGAGTMIGMASSSLFSIEKGKNDYTAARSYLANGFILWFVIAIVIMVFFYFTARFFIELQIAGSSEAIKAATDYFKIVIPMSFFVMGASAVPLFIRNDDRPRLATQLMIFGAVFNAIGDYVFIKHLGRGMRGAAEATISAQMIISIVGIGYFFSSKARVRLHFWDLKFSWRKSVKILSLGVSSLMIFFYYGFITGLYNYLFAKYGGSLMVAAYSVVGFVSYLYYMFAEGFTSGVQPLLSFNYGAVRYYNIRRLLWKTTRILFWLYVVFLIAIILFPNELAALYTSEGDVALRAAVVRGMRLHLFVCFLEAFILMGTVYFQSVDRPKTATLISGVNLVIQLPFILILPRYLGTDGVWLGYPLANIPLALFVFVCVVRDLKRMTYLLLEKHKLVLKEGA